MANKKHNPAFYRFNFPGYQLALSFLIFFSFPLIKVSSALLAQNNDWNHGFDHPLQGWDHILTMIAVGVWAAQLRGSAIWLLPLTFVSVMSLGGLAGVASFAIPSVEMMILLSGLVFSVFIVRKVQFTHWINILIVAFFAFFHGYAHGQEISASASLMSYTLGFVLATLLLHCAGIATTRFIALAFAFFVGSNVNAQETEVITPEVTKTTVKSKQKVNNDEPVELEEIVVTSDGRAKNLLGVTGFSVTRRSGSGSI